jgi:hypothetical protein
VPTVAPTTATTAAPTPSSRPSASALAPGEFQRANDKPAGLFGTPVTRSGCSNRARFGGEDPASRIRERVTGLVVCFVDVREVDPDRRAVQVDPTSAAGRAVLARLARPSEGLGDREPICFAIEPSTPATVFAETARGTSRLVVPTSYCGDQLPGAAGAVRRAHAALAG